jgi:hypothetical protein
MRRQHHRWILGNKPVIVGLGVDETSYALSQPFFSASFPLFGSSKVDLGDSLKLVTEADMDAVVSHLITLDSSPPKDIRADSPPDPRRKVIELDQPKTLREVFQQQLWKQSEQKVP